MLTLVQFDFPFSGPFGAEMTAALGDLARSITAEPGFLWKIWTEEPEAGEAGGVYLFRDEASARAYVEKHSARLAGFGIQGIRAKVFRVNADLSAITLGPVTATP